MKKQTQKSEQILAKISSGSTYRGKSVVVIGDEVHVLSTTNGKARIKVLTDLIKKYPDQTPLISFIPKADTLILIL